MSGRPQIVINRLDTFGYLTVVKRAKKMSNGQIQWLCACVCGGSKIVSSTSLKNGSVKSCGCLKKESPSKRFKKHGMSYTKTYAVWINMIQRVTNKNSSQYKDYGGRGINIAPEWFEFTSFLKDMGERPADMFLDRIDNNKGYYKENCRWATRKQQNNNARSNRLFTYKGKTQNISQWAEEYGLKRQTLYDRVCTLGWKFEDAITSNFKKRRKNTFKTYRGKPIKAISTVSV